MSVVNKMLRDLDRRQADPGEAVYTQHLRPVDEASRGRKLLVGALALLVLILGGALVYAIRQPATESVAATPVPNAIPATPIAAPTPPAAPTATIADSASMAEEAAATPAPAAQSADAAPAEIVPPLAAVAPAAPAKAAKAETPKVVEPVPIPMEQSAAVAQSAPSAPVVEAPVPTQQHSGPTRIDVRPRSLPANTAEGEFNRAVALINQGRTEEARAALASALKIQPTHEGARQTLAVLQVEAGLLDAAQATLAEGLKLNPAQPNFTMLLARLKVERGDAGGALSVLRAHQQQGASNAELRAFAGTLLQRAGRHAEAVDEYRAALAGSPNVGIWWVGLGMSYEATERSAEAIDAYNRARASGNLPPEVREYVERKLQILR